VLEFRILGPLEVVGERGQIQLGGAKQRATLAILLLSANRVVSVDRIADDLYAGAAPVTALKQVQRQISDLRKVLGSSSVIETRSPGYVVRLSADQLDLSAFERLTAGAAEALAEGQAQRATDLFRQALDLWRGAPLADLTYQSFARAPIERLEEIRLAALQQRIDAELALGRTGELVAELEEHVAEHPLQERFCAQLMLALYRSGRQAEALEEYRGARERLVDDFGIEPTPALQQLERQILTQDPSLQLQPPSLRRIAPPGEADRTVLVVPPDEGALDGLVSLAEPLARAPGNELIIARLLADEGELAEAAALLETARQALGVKARAAAFTSSDQAGDIVRLAAAYDVDLVLVGAPREIEATLLPEDLVAMLEYSPADVGITSGRPVDWVRGAGVFVPFGGAQHDWAALELGAWLAAGVGTELRVVGTRADPRRGQRDASRLLANASLAVQRLAGVTGEPLLVEPAAAALVEAVEPATLVVIGVSPRWRREGIGDVRRALVRDARPTVVLVHGGPRPGGLAPRDMRTRFSWSLEV
jgi:DNA-binding SARP family transcriptional activator